MNKFLGFLLIILGFVSFLIEHDATFGLVCCFIGVGVFFSKGGC